MHTALTNGKSSRPVETILRERLERGDGNTILFIAPTEQARLKQQRECLERAPRHAAAGLNIHTFESLVDRFARRTGLQRPVSRGLQMLWLRDIVDNGRYPSLKSNSEIPLPERTIAELLNAISRLKAEGIDASQMRSESSDSEFRNLTAVTESRADFISIYEKFSERLGSRWIDWTGAIREVADQLGEASDRSNQLMHRSFPGVDLVIASDVDISCGADLSVLEGMARLPGLVTYISFDWNAENDALFGHMKQSYTRLLDLGFHEMDEPENRPSRFADSARYLSQHLFRKIPGAVPSDEKVDLTNRITLLKTRDRVKEVEAAAELIKGSSSDLHRICLTYYNLDRYAPLINEIFPIYGIPYTLTETIPLSISRFAVAFLSLLDSIEGNLTSGSVDRLESPYFVIEDLASFVADCAFKDAMSPGGFKRSVAGLMRISKAKQQILYPGGALLREVQPSIIEHEIGALHGVESLVVELVEFLSSRHGNNEPLPLRMYIERLRFMLSQTSYPVEPQTESGVSVLSLPQTRGLDFDVVILGGLVDAEFPEIRRSDAFLPRSLRREASDLLREQRCLFYRALNLFREHLYLVAPERDGDVNLIQSPFIEELAHIADFASEQSKSDALFSPEHLLMHYGKHIWTQLEEGDRCDTSGPHQFTNLTSTVRRAMPLVEHSVRVEKSRGVTRSLPQYEGRLSPQLLSASSREGLHDRHNRTYSIGELESYGQCPFQFFSKYVLRLEHEREEQADEDGLTSLGKGAKLHEILAEFYTQRRGKPPIAQCTDAEFDAALQELTQIARNTLAAYAPGNLFWEVEMETIIGGKGRHGILPRFLDQERERELEVEPGYFGVGFGPRNSSTQGDSPLGSQEPVKVGEVNLKGTIDRIEIGEGIFTVGDYTTGANLPKIRAIREGRSLKLPIQLAVAAELLGKLTSDDTQAAGAIYYVLRENGRAELGIGDREYNGIAFRKAHSNNQQLLPGGTNSRSRPVAPGLDSEEETLDSIIDRSVQYVSEYVSSMSNGQFPLTPHDPKDVCRYCDFKRICRIGGIPEDAGDG